MIYIYIWEIKEKGLTDKIREDQEDYFCYIIFQSLFIKLIYLYVYSKEL